jgi:hypothetical protein
LPCRRACFLTACPAPRNRVGGPCRFIRLDRLLFGNAAGRRITGRRKSCLSRDPACYDPTAHRRSCVRRVLYAEISRRTDAMRLVLRATLIAAMMRTPQVFNNIKRCVQNFRYERMYEETAAFRGRRWDRSWTHAEGVSCHVRCRRSRIYTHSGRLAGVLCRAQSTKHGSSQKRNSVVLSRTCRSAAENQTLGIA